MRDFWQRRAVSTQRHLNLGWWVATLLPIVVGLHLALAVVHVFWRSRGWPIETLVAIGAGLTVLAMAGAYAVARRRFHTREDAMLWLDLAEGLQGRLCTAMDGAKDYPPAAPRLRGRLVWRKARVLLPVIAVVATHIIAAVLPVTVVQPEVTMPVGRPVAWSNIASAIEVLEEEKVADETLLDEWRQNLEALEKQEPTTWFEHSTMEASDHLWEGMQDALARMEREVASVERGVDGVMNSPADDAARKAAESALAEQLEKLGSNNSKLSKQMKDMLAEVRPSQIPSMSDEARDKLERKMQIGREALRRARQAGEGEPGPGKPEDGEIQRGPGHAPLRMTKDAKDLEAGREERLDGYDAARAAIGDVVKTDATTHEVDPTKFKRTTGGTTEATGSGGAAVWRTSWIPAEQTVLEKYFE